MKNTVRLGINGFGRIGRLITRISQDFDNVEVVGINDPFLSADYAKYLLERDSMHGNFKGSIELNGDTLVVNGRPVKFFAVMNPEEIDWKSANVDYVVECTGKFTTIEDASKHLKGGAKRVIISAPSKDAPMFVYGVNHETLTAEDNIISAASCTTNCLAPMAKALNDLAEVQSGIMLTVHAYTGDQMVLDGPHRKGDLRRARAAAVNIVPNSTGAAKAIGLVIPELNGKLIGSAQRVPVPTGSSTLLFAVVKADELTVDQINAHMKSVATPSYGYTEEQLVSSDVIGMTYGSLFDATQTMVNKVADGLFEVQVVSWYDNENSYTSQMVRTIKYLAEKCN